MQTRDAIHCDSCQRDYIPGPAGLCPYCMAGLAQEALDAGEPVFDEKELAALRKAASQLQGIEVLDTIGHGGMGVVFRAQQTRLGRVVALKMLARELATSPDMVARFEREARTLAQLTHPNVVTVHDFGLVEGYPYLVMELIEGPTLRQVLDAGRLPPERALHLAPAICSALEYAHTKGVVHRDIKPENILLTPDGQVKIADFGLAKLLKEGPAHLTQTNMVMGTPHYMAPEQWENPRGVDHRADIYALGVVIYEMLTGELPIGRFPPPSQKIEVDVRLDDVVLRALQKEPQQRYQRASEMSSAMAHIRNTHVTIPTLAVGHAAAAAAPAPDGGKRRAESPRKPRRPTPPRRPGSSRRKRGGGAVVIVLLLFGGGVFLMLFVGGATLFVWNRDVSSHRMEAEVRAQRDAHRAMERELEHARSETRRSHAVPSAPEDDLTVPEPRVDTREVPKGQVASIDDREGWVKIDLNSLRGVKKGDELRLMRGGSEIARALVISVDERARTCRARLQGNSKTRDVLVGDHVQRVRY